MNPETDLTFAKGLRALVRQDPDVILVGEIRDSETAEIAVNAALTGIMIFTSFHAGDAAITIPRLLDMGIEPFLFSIICRTDSCSTITQKDLFTLQSRRTNYNQRVEQNYQET